MVALMDLLTATQILEFSGINNDQKPIFLIDQDLCFKSLFMHVNLVIDHFLGVCQN